MTKVFRLLLALWLMPLLAMSQKDTVRLLVGLDLLRSVPSYYDAGYTFEPSLLYTINNRIQIEAAFGISSISINPIYTNVDYKCNGNYARAGFRLPFGGNSDLSFGLSLGYSTFTEVGKSIFKGKYFGDFTYEKSQRNNLLFVEPSLNYQCKIYRRFSLILQLRLPYVLSSYNTESFPLYSAPGIGFLRFLAPDSDAKTPKSILGLSARVIYKLF